MEDISSEAPKIVRGPRSRPVEQELKAQEYVICDLTVRTNGQEMHEVPPHRYAKWIGEVVEIEGPVHTDEVVRRIVDAAEIKRIGNRIESAFEAGVTYRLKESEVG